MKRLVCILLIVLFISTSVLAGQEEGVKVETLAKTSHSWNSEGLPDYPKGRPKITILRIKVSPGTTLPIHKHPVINAGYMLKGSLKVVTEDGRTLNLKAGDAIVEVVNKWHYGINESGDDAEILVFYAGEAGKALTIDKQTD